MSTISRPTNTTPATLPTRVDPVTFEIVRHRLWSINEEAGHTLQDILPENTPLRFTYVGGREDLEGLRCVIVNQEMGGQRQVIISSMSRSAE